MRIELAVPLDSLHAAPLVTIEADGQVIDQFRAATKTIACCRSASITAMYGAEVAIIPSMHADDRPRQRTR